MYASGAAVHFVLASRLWWPLTTSEKLQTGVVFDQKNGILTIELSASVN